MGTNNPRYKFDNSNDGVISMIIEDITHKDEGHYRCRAENTEGLASTSAYLFVRDGKDDSHSNVHAMDIEEVVIREGTRVTRSMEKNLTSCHLKSRMTTSSRRRNLSNLCQSQVMGRPRRRQSLPRR